MAKQHRVDTAQSGAAAEIEGGMPTGKVPTRDDADAYELDDLPGNLRQVVAQASETKLPIVILESGRSVAAVLDFGELQRRRVHPG
jgi:hypothetical protein